MKFQILKKIFLFYLYIFFCFGYTTGTDWRFYELLYNYGSDDFFLHRNVEQGFYYFIYFVRQVIPDFWLFLGLVKCIYFYAAVRVIKIFSKDIFIIIAILMNYQLLFMLIDNPLRFMCGSIFLLFATPFLVKEKYFKFLIVSIFAVFFHLSLMFPVLIALLIKLRKRPFFKVKRNLIFIYCIAFAISFLPALISSLRGILAVAMPFFANKLLESYLIKGTDVNFTIGSLIRVGLFFLFISYKDKFEKVKYGGLIFFGAFLYFIISRALINLPTGFRISLFFSVFFAIGLFFIMQKLKFHFKIIIVVIVGVSMLKDVWNVYQYIPYTNSVYYIATGEHLPYSYREQLNKREFKNRTGKILEDKIYRIE